MSDRMRVFVGDDELAGVAEFELRAESSPFQSFEDSYHYTPQSREMTWNVALPESSAHSILEMGVGATRSLRFDQQYPISRWYRIVARILRFAYGWLGYKGPPESVGIRVDEMRLVSMRRRAGIIEAEFSNRRSSDDLG